MRITLNDKPETERRFFDSPADEQLVSECIKGNQEAWSQLIDKYKNLIFSIPLKYGFSRDEAGDIFQDVCLGLLSELPTIREPRALPKWIMQVTAHKCFHWKHKRSRFVSSSYEEVALPQPEVAPEVLEILRQAEEEQIIRQAMSALSPRCRHLVHMLFFEQPSRPYKDIAVDLGIAVGSIGFLRQRCINQMKKKMDELGFL